MRRRDIRGLARFIRKKRQAAGMSAAELARRTGVTRGTITRLEQGEIAEPRPATLKAIAVALGLSARDLLVAGNYLGVDELPSLNPYLRSKYGYLSDSAQTELQDAFSEIIRRHGYNPKALGPEPGQDET